MTDGQVIPGCTGKERFESRALAIRIAKRRKQRDRSGDVYRCEHCRGYHIGRSHIGMNKGRAYGKAH